MLFQAFGDRLVLVINTGIKPELLDHGTTLLSATGDADHTTAKNLGKLPDDRSDGSCCSRDDDSLTRLRLPDLKQAKVRSHAGRSKAAQIGRKRSQLGIDFEKTLGRTDILRLDPGHPKHCIPRYKRRRSGLQHMTHTTRAHHIAQGDRGQIATHVVEPTSHRGVHRNVFNGHAQISFLESRGRIVRHPPGRGGGQSARASVEADLGRRGLSGGIARRHSKNLLGEGVTRHDRAPVYSACLIAGSTFRSAGACTVRKRFRCSTNNSGSSS